jgi:hypothetical protein
MGGQGEGRYKGHLDENPTVVADSCTSFGIIYLLYVLKKGSTRCAVQVPFQELQSSFKRVCRGKKVLAENKSVVVSGKFVYCCSKLPSELLHMDPGTREILLLTRHV